MSSDTTSVDPDALIMEVLTSDHGRADPYSRYRQVRDVAPVHHSAATDVWYLTDYPHSKSVLHDPRFGRGSDLLSGRMAAMDDADTARRRAELRSGSENMLFADPPEHTRLRGLVSRAFTPRRVEAMRSEIATLAEPCFDAMADAGEVDVMDVLAFPLPVAVIGELVGVPPEDREQFRWLVRDTTAMIEAVPDSDALARAERSMREMRAYFDDLVDRRRTEPADDLLSALIELEDNGDRLSRGELISTAILLFAAGFETTTNLIGNGLRTALEHPGQLERIREDPSLIPSAVDEILRYESPVQLDARTALVDADIAGTAVPAGTFVITFLGAGNRDPAIYPDPETFDVSRDGAEPLSFGWGIHHCLGAHLARAEGQEVLRGVLDRFSSIELVDDHATWRSSVTLRGLEHLRVRAQPR